MKRVAPKLPPHLEEGSLALLKAEAALEGVRLHNLSIELLKVPGMTIDEAILEKIVAVGAKLDNLRVSDTRIAVSDFSGASCADASLLRTDILNCRGSGWDLSRTVIKDVVFKDCKLGMANFRYAKLTRVQFVGCSLAETDFQAAALDQVAFQNCLLDKIEFAQSSLKNVDLRSSQLVEVRGWQYLKGVTLDYTQLIAVASQLAQALELKIEE